MLGDMQTELFHEFFYAVSYAGAMNLGFAPKIATLASNMYEKVACIQKNIGIGIVAVGNLDIVSSIHNLVTRPIREFSNLTFEFGRVQQEIEFRNGSTLPDPDLGKEAEGDLGVDRAEIPDTIQKMAAVGINMYVIVNEMRGNLWNCCS